MTTFTYLTRRALLTLAIAGAMLACGSSASAAGNLMFGLMEYSNPSGRDFERMGAAGAKRFRLIINWRDVEPNQPDRTPVIGTGHSYDWSAVDEMMRGMLGAGIRGTALIYSTPSWINREQEEPPLETKADRDDYRAFLRALVTRYGTNGTFFVENPSIPNKPLRSFQIWNEQNSSVRYLPEVDPHSYAQLLKISHTEIESVDPRAKIVLGGMFGTPGTPNSMTAWRYLSGLYRIDGFREHFDVLALHPYSPNLYGVKYQIKRIRKVLRTYNDGRRRLDITEIGWSSSPPRSSGYLFKGRSGQARLLGRAFDLLMKKRRRWHIRTVHWLSWSDPEVIPANCSYCKRSGLTKSDGTSKPALKVYRRLARR